MKDQVVMNKYNAQVCIAVPLFRMFEHETLTHMQDYSICCYKNEPVAYVLVMGDDCQVFSAEWVEKYMIFMGDL